ncbi:DNA binding protein-like [Striga asiatica]|uniref:DNA binding protein-like n=1 Tax=Striga asiatica TaxID=4170 RepID=A0A5A7PZV9_STRAF|nr:DNA binding protein-like [Striga asiatica]
MYACEHVAYRCELLRPSVRLSPSSYGTVPLCGNLLKVLIWSCPCEVRKSIWKAVSVTVARTPAFGNKSINNFKECYETTCMTWLDKSNMGDVHLVSHSRFFVKDEIDDLKTGDVAVTSVYSLYEIEETPRIWVCATIESVIDDWCYLPCRRCTGKIKNTDDKVECTKCKGTVGIYRICFGICDDTANATLILWGRECERIIGRQCHSLKSAFVEQNPMSFELPEEVDNLVGKTMLFKNATIEDEISSPMKVIQQVVSIGE